jgi:hypothetical protein
MAVLQPYKDDYYLWHYLPSVPAAVIFLLLFLGCSFGLIWRSWKAHVKFGIPFIIGTFCQSAKSTSTNVLLRGLLIVHNSRSSRLWCPSICLPRYLKRLPVRSAERVHLARTDLDGSYDLHDLRKIGVCTAC